MVYSSTLIAVLTVLISLLGFAGCGGDDNGSANGGGAEAPANPPGPTGPSPTNTSAPRAPASGADWNSITLHAVGGGAVTEFRVGDDGNFTASPSGRTGKISDNDLARLDSRIDAIKEDAHDEIKCRISPVAIDVAFRTSVTFENRSPATVYLSTQAQNQECWTASYLPTLELNSELTDLQLKYVLGAE